MKDFNIAKYLKEHNLGSYGMLNHYIDLKPLKEDEDLDSEMQDTEEEDPLSEDSSELEKSQQDLDRAAAASANTITKLVQDLEKAGFSKDEIVAQLEKLKKY